MTEKNPTIYKYTNNSGARKILENRTLRFAHTSELNDPFDVYIEDVFGMDVSEVLDQSAEVLMQDLQSNPVVFAEKCGTSIEDAQFSAARLKKAPDSEKKVIKALINSISETDPLLQKYKQGMLEGREQIEKVFKTYGVFCATRRHDNLLMWAHYSDKHKGAVLGFNPDVEHDSALRLMEPVIYRSERPGLVEKSQLGFKEGIDFTIEQIVTETSKRLLHTKSTEWEYEQELRLAIPFIIEEGKKEWFLNLVYPHELTQVFLGYRMDEEEKKKLIILAKNFNPNVQIYSTQLMKRQYRLEFKEIS